MKINSKILWTPPSELIVKTQMTGFTRWLEERTNIQIENYQALHKWSVVNLETFWEKFLEYSQIIYDGSYEKVLSSHAMPGAKWFESVQINYAENILEKNYSGTALICLSEPIGTNENSKLIIRKYSFEELKILVIKCADAIKYAGIKKGDRIAGYMANVPETIIAALACASLGITWSSTSPDFGLEAVCDRFDQIKPKLVFTSTHYVYNGRVHSTENVVKELKSRIKSIEKIISVPYPVEEGIIVGDSEWNEFINSSKAESIEYVRVVFDHPLFIMFSSGTTGVPKCIIHGTGGTLLQHIKEHRLHCDLKPNDILFYFTTCGWMMWNWQLSALASGSTICLYDGSPSYPKLTSLWEIADQFGITHFGTSGRYIESCMKSQPPIEKGSLGNFQDLQIVLYTGSPLSTNGFEWVYNSVKNNIQLAGISGGTDIISCFVLGNPNLPVHAGRIQCKGLGVDAIAFDDGGNEIFNKPGELVCSKPIPSMPIGFLNDPCGEKYFNAYFSNYPNVWRHGDYIEFFDDGSSVIYGRSDATLNPSGVRIGCSEIYAALDSLNYILGAMAVGWIPINQSDEIIILLVVLSNGTELNERTEFEIKKVVREKTSPRHVPQKIFSITELPITKSGKPVELAVKAILGGKAVSNKNALANPIVLEEIEQIKEKLINSFRET